MFFSLNKTSKVICIILVIGIFVGFGYYYYQCNRPSHTEKPVITLNKDATNKISVKTSKEDLLKDVTASDKEDGDVTSSVIIESISTFIDKNKRNVTYVAFDSDNNVTKLKREIEYTDYKAPKIEAVKKLEIRSKKISEILACFKATDLIDGDISDRIKIDELTVTSSKNETYEVELSVTNSCGDITTTTQTITVK